MDRRTAGAMRNTIEQPTQRAQVACGKWLVECLRLGWERDQLDFLEALWWKYHDNYGRLKSAAEDSKR